jgi:hypothetical protein
MGDYRRFKTPFYEITVSDPNGKRKIKLPQHLLNLVSKIDIQRTIGDFDVINIEMVEGSREPGSQDPTLGTSGLYNIDNNIGGSITNRTGAIADLRFSGTNGITFFTDFERKQGALDRRVQKNRSGKLITRTHKKEPKAPVFLFQERNLVTIRWGYKENPSEIASITGRILMLTTSYPDIGPIKSKIMATSPEVFLDQVTATKGKTFGEIVTTGFNDKILSVKDKPTDQLLEEICKSLNMNCVVSSKLPAEKLEKDRSKVMVAGQSFQQFLTELARRHNCYYRIHTNSSGKETLVFVKKEEYEKEPILSNSELFTYKSPGSIIKNISIKADFGKFATSAQVGSTENGTPKTTKSEVELMVTHEVVDGGRRENIHNLDPRDINLCRDTSNLLNQ